MHISTTGIVMTSNFPGAYKYLQFHSRRRESEKTARKLGLDASPPLDILDIGTGSGHFVVACRGMGHRCTGLDMVGSPLPNQFARWCLGLRDTVIFTIRPKVPLPAIGRFDLITSFRSQFQFIDANRSWTLDEWSFFLDDVLGLLRDGGRFVLKMPTNKNIDSGITRHSPELMGLFRSYGATVGKSIIFPSRSPAQSA